MKLKSFLAILLPSLALWLGVNAATPQTSIAAIPAENAVLATFTFPDLRMGAFQNAVLPGTITNDRNFFIGGVGSDLWRDPNGAPDEAWMLTDRGPNGLVNVSGQNRRTWPVPEFDPMILRVRAQSNGSIAVLQTIPIVTQSGLPVTGMPNIQGYDEVPWTWDALTRLSFNPNGLDPEGLVRTSGGDFWLADEYSPSLVHLDPAGKVLKRYVPAGVNLTGTDYPVAYTLPSIFGKRKINRGFEGISLSRDQKTLYVVLQSPLSNPNSTIGNASRNTRVLVFNIPTETVTAEYVYRFEDVRDFTSNTKTDPTEMKLSAVVALNASTLLIDERTDLIAKIYSVALNKATNILGSKWDDPATSPSLEGLADPAASGVTVLPKTLVVDLSKLPGMPDKIEGMLAFDSKIIGVANDNDFECCSFDSAGNNVGTGVKSKILAISLSNP